MRRLAILAFFLPVSSLGQSYLDPKLSFEERAKDLVHRMTLPEKVSQMVNEAAAIPRLKMPSYDWWSEGLHGVARNGTATVFPQAIGLGATFDPDLIFQIASATSDEARVKYRQAQANGQHGTYQGLTFFAPNINIFRDPRWGRGQETYGEDPYLTGRMAVQYVKGMQGNDPRYLKTVATPKHYAVHSGPESTRLKFNANPSKYDLWDTYLPAFEAAVREGKAYSVMGAYSALFGIPDNANPFLLRDTLRQKWGFQGYVVSDCGAIDSMVTEHKFVKTREEAASIAVKAGCDLECGGAYSELVSAVAKGLITENEVDRALTRLFTARMRLGMFDPPAMVPFMRIPDSNLDSAAHKALALKAARESMVLLQNKGSILPLRPSARIAVIGPNADATQVLLGNYNGQPSHAVTPREGIANGHAGTTIYAQGCGLTELSEWAAVPSEVLASGEPAEKQGLVGYYFGNVDMLYGALLRRVDKTVDFDWGDGSPSPDVPKDNFSASWTGKLVAPETGEFDLGCIHDDGARLYFDGKLIFEDWTDGAPRLTSAKVHLEKGRQYNVVLHFYEHGQGAVAKFVWRRPAGKPFADAVAAARRSDAIVACVGLSGALEGEGQDRTSIELPKVQLDLLKALKSTGKPLVAVLINGSAVGLSWIKANADAILEAWYPGQAGGTALADVIFGRYSPSGRLPVTLYASDAQLPGFTNYSMSNRTYRYFKGKPAFEFGYGLSYSKFSYSMPRIVSNSEQGVDVEVTVKNVGKRSSEEVSQLYLKHLDASQAPKLALKGIYRPALKPGQSQRLHFHLSPLDLSLPDASGVRTVQPGHYSVFVGGSQPGSNSKPAVFRISRLVKRID